MEIVYPGTTTTFPGSIPGPGNQLPRGSVPGSGALAVGFTTEGHDEVEVQPEATPVNPCACSKCGKILKTPAGRGAHEAHCDGTPPTV